MDSQRIVCVVCLTQMSGRSSATPQIRRKLALWHADCFGLGMERVGQKAQVLVREAARSGYARFELTGRANYLNSLITEALLDFEEEPKSGSWPVALSFIPLSQMHKD